MKATLARLVQSSSNWTTVGLTLFASVILTGGVVLLRLLNGIPISDLTRDPTVIAEVPFYTGMLSQFGAFLWAAAATVCIFSAAVLPERSHNRRIRNFLFVSGLLTLLLGLDDLFLLHEEAFPLIGIPEKVVFAIYAALFLWYLLHYSATIVETECVLLGMALVFFAGSIAADLLLPSNSITLLFEDGSKVSGIVSWLVYFSRTGASAVKLGMTQSIARAGSNSIVPS